MNPRSLIPLRRDASSGIFPGLRICRFKLESLQNSPFLVFYKSICNITCVKFLGGLSHSFAAALIHFSFASAATKK